ncbi:MAG: hypothetical protein QXW71_00405 [Thermoplasmata archaeon]
MWYAYSYDPRKCSVIGCDLCTHKIECLHYSQLPDGPAFQETVLEDEDFRIATKMDIDEHFRLINTYTKRLTKLGYPENEMKKLVNLIYVLYKGSSFRRFLEEITKKIEEGELYPLQLYDLLVSSLDPELKTWIQETAESGRLEMEKAMEYMEWLNEGEVPEELLIEFLIEKKARSFTGEIRLVPILEEEEEEKGEEKYNEWINLKKLILNVVTLKSGKRAYESSEKAKDIINKIGEKHYYEYLDKAWKLRKELRNLPPEKRLKRAKAQLGI